MQERGYEVDHSTIQRWVVYTASIKQYNADENKRVKIRQCKYLNNIVEQDHRFIKRIIRPMPGFKSFRSAQATLAGMGLWQMLKKDQNKSSQLAWEQFYAKGTYRFKSTGTVPDLEQMMRHIEGYKPVR
ncbi:MAG: putative transposase [Halioglobus sp.]|jgi:putative transposase